PLRHAGRAVDRPRRATRRADRILVDCGVRRRDGYSIDDVEHASCSKPGVVAGLSARRNRETRATQKWPQSASRTASPKPSTVNTAREALAIDTVAMTLAVM